MTHKTATLTVVRQPNVGSITATTVGSGSTTVISNCTSTCTADLSYDKTCDPPPTASHCTDDHKTVRLTASRSDPGWRAFWISAYCDSKPSPGVCELDVTESKTAYMNAWDDIQPPKASWPANAPAKVGRTTGFSANTADNGSVYRVDFYVDDAYAGRDQDGAPFNFYPQAPFGVNGSHHVIKAIAFDNGGNQSTSVAAAPAHDFVTDSDAHLDSVTGPATEVNSAPAFTFVRPPDATSVSCETYKGATFLGSMSCTSPYVAQTGGMGDGEYTVKLTVQDDVGNYGTTSRPFTIDTVAPTVAITGGPAEGATEASRSVSFSFTGSDPHGVAFACKLDGGDFGPCSGADSHALNDLSSGSHTFVIRATDRAGNSATAQRSFTVDAPVPSGGGGTNPGGVGTPTSPGNQGGTDPPVVAARSSTKFAVKRGRTRVVKLSLSGLVRGEVVEVSCKGKGCPRGSTRFDVKKQTLNVASVFKKRTLRAGAKIEVRVTQKGRRGELFRYTTQKGKKKPKAESVVLPAG